MIGNAYLKLKLFKRKIPLKALYSYKGTRKVKDFQKDLIKKFRSLFNLIVLINTKELSNSFHDHTSFKWHYILSQKSFDVYIFSVYYTLIHFCLPLNPAIHRMGNTPKILCPRCRDQDESQPTQALQSYYRLDQ